MSNNQIYRMQNFKGNGKFPLYLCDIFRIETHHADNPITGFQALSTIWGHFWVAVVKVQLVSYKIICNFFPKRSKVAHDKR